MLGNILFFCCLFFQKKFRNFQDVKQLGSRSGHSVGPDLDPNYLQRLSADGKSPLARKELSKNISLDWSYYCNIHGGKFKIYITVLNFSFLFNLIVYIPSTIFQLNRDGSSWVEPVLS